METNCLSSPKSHIQPVSSAAKADNELVKPPCSNIKLLNSKHLSTSLAHEMANTVNRSNLEAKRALFEKSSKPANSNINHRNSIAFLAATKNTHDGSSNNRHSRFRYSSYLNDLDQMLLHVKTNNTNNTSIVTNRILKFESQQQLFASTSPKSINTSATANSINMDLEDDSMSGFQPMSSSTCIGGSTQSLYGAKKLGNKLDYQIFCKIM